MNRFSDGQSGFITVALLSFIIAMTILMGAVAQLIESNTFAVNRNIQSQKAFNIAEAGINYYLWHLSHNNSDFKDGKSTPATPDPTLGYGPYIHDYYNTSAVNEGTYTLWIKPQGGGSSMATIRSVGRVKNTNVIRTIDAIVGAPSFASYSVVSDSALWFGNTESATGPVHSNQGVRMDGASTTDVTSLNPSYTPSGSSGGDGNSHPGVWCDQSIVSPVNCNTRNKSDWRYPVPVVEFNSVTADLCNMKKTAFLDDSLTSALVNQANPCNQTPNTRTAAYLPQRGASYNTRIGYLINLNNNGTYDLYQVNNENDTLTPYSSALSRSLVATGIPYPTSGVIFSEDNVWVRSNPTFHGRLTIAAARLASSSSAQIVIADDIIYSTKNGSDALGLVSEESIFVAPYAPPSSGSFNFEIDAALLAQSGNVTFGENSNSSTRRAGYRSNTSSCVRGWTNSNQRFVFYGSVATRLTWTWTWIVSSHCGDASQDPAVGWISGIEHNDTQYDYNLLYNPPPSFPITSTYNVLSWREVLTTP